MPLRQGTQAQWGPLTVGNDQAAGIGTVGEFDSGGQQASVLLKMNIAGYVQPANPKDSSSDNECYVVADLAAGSVVSPGDVGANDDENRGYYTHAIDVQMWFDDVYAVETEAPPPSAVSGSGSVSSGSSESVGFFGDQLTATGSWSTSQGGARTYQDYEIESHTTHKTNLGGSEVMKQHLALRLCDTGPYVTPFSLVKSDQYLAGLPPRAIGNLPLMSAASFKAVAPVKHSPAQAKLHVKVKPWLAKVTWWSMTAPRHWFGHPDLGGQQVQAVGGGVELETVAEYDLTRGPGGYPLATAGVPTGVYLALPWSNEFVWSFDVDFANGSVVPA
jgi:hypothetical protein